MSLRSYGHKTNSYLALEADAILKNRTEDLEDSFRMLSILYARTDNAAAEKAKHHLAIALGELKAAIASSNSVYETLGEEEKRMRV
jgi:hypothetical protein